MRAPVDPMLRVANLRVAFGGLTAVDDVSLEVGRGETRGLIGPNGAGKTTLFNALSGLVPVESGEVVLDGKDLSRLPAYQRAASGLRRTFQSLQLVQQATVIENVLIGMHAETPQSALRLLVDWRIRAGADHRAQQVAYDILNLLHIAELALHPLEALSFAQLRRVEIARALAGGPRVLMLDEPAAGLSQDDIDELKKLLEYLRRERGLTILIIEHVLSLVFSLCDRVTVLDAGKVIADATPEEIARDAVVRRAYLGAGDAPAL